MAENGIEIYQTEDGQTQIDVRVENDTAWHSQAQMVELFQKTPQNITMHIRNAFKDGGLDEKIAVEVINAMNRILRIATVAWLMIWAVVAGATEVRQGNDVQQAKGLAARLSPELAQKVEFRLMPAAADACAVWGEGSRVVVAGNNAGSMAVGLNEYLRRYCHTTVSWYADVPVELPDVLPDVRDTVRVSARVPQRFFLNYCTYGYTMTYWQWSDWERFIDWMALNGINLPLAITGQEAVWYRVWTSLGMTDEQVRSYFTGPSYLPWHRMANIDGWCGPLPKQWLDGQVELQQRIVERERALNMRPVLPAFAGHVPGQLRELFPQADIQQLSPWAGFDEQYRTYFLNSEDSLYDVIQRRFLEEQTRLFGTDHIYGVDPFNEVDPPSFEPDYLNRVAKHIYESLTAVDPQAEWLQMAWFFYYEQENYTPERVQAMLSGVPQGRMTLLDYYCEFKEMWRDLSNFYGQPYVWCYLGNFGGNSGMAGNVKEAARRLDAALLSGGDNLVGIGSTLEGLDVQQFPYELIMHKAWDDGLDDDHMVAVLARCHAGRPSADVQQAWNVLYHQVLTMTPINFCCPLPCSYPQLGKERSGSAVRYERAKLLEAWQLLLNHDGPATDALTVDLVWTGRQLLGDLFGDCKRAFDLAVEQGDAFGAAEQSMLMMDLLADLDTLNAAHPHATLSAWLEQARALGDTPELSDYYERNARTIITTWGGSLNDYACRNWNGLLSDYYARRWKLYIDASLLALDTGQAVDDDARQAATRELQRAWPLSTTPVTAVASPDAMAFSRHLRDKYATQWREFISR